MRKHPLIVLPSQEIMIRRVDWGISAMRLRALLLVVVIPGLTNAAVGTFEGDRVPEQVGWERVGSFDADRWIKDGWFFQRVELGIWAPPPVGEADFYRRSVGAFAGAEHFFIEWQAESGAPESDIAPNVNGTPTVLSASGDGNALYHFTMTDERVRVIRDTALPVAYVDIAAGLAHTYRLELRGDQWFAWFIDGAVIDSGTPYGVYPRADSRVVWGTRYYLQEHTARWDYIRWGNIPLDGSGDFDSDEDVDGRDYYFFHECLTSERIGINGGPGNDAGPGCRFADFDADSDVDLHDVADFQRAFTPPE
jgi:hypothetical protein